MRHLISLAVVALSVSAVAQEEEDVSATVPETSATVTNDTPRSVETPRTVETPNASHTVERGDTLWDLSRRYLGSSWYWPKVWSYNPDIANPHWIYPGNMVRFYGADEQPTQVEVGTEVPDVEESAMYADDADGVTKAGQIGYRPKNSVTIGLMSFVTTKELEQTARIIGSFAENEMITYPYSVYVDITGKKSLRVGDSTVIYREGGEVIHPRTKSFVGYLTRIVAEGKVTAVDTKKNIATVAVVRSLDEVHRGDSVSPSGESVLRTVAPRPNEREIKGAVLIGGAKRYTVMQSESFVVLLDKGADDGVKPGNSFTFFRSGDTASTEKHFAPAENDDAFPRENVGSCIVVDVKSRVSGCLLLRTMRELVPGDTADMLVGAARATR